MEELQGILRDSQFGKTVRLAAGRALYFYFSERGDARMQEVEFLMDSIVSTGEDIEYSLARVENLMKYGYLNKASQYFLTREKKKRTSDQYLLEANTKLLQNPPREVELLELLNKMYSERSLSSLKKMDLSQPLSLSNLSSTLDHVEGHTAINSQPKISIVIPIYNSETTIEYSVRSILNQSWRNLEVVLVDDASSDASLGVISSLFGSNSRVKIISLSSNKGAYEARNTGMAAATGDYVTIHDADDWSHPQMLEQQMVPILKGKGQIGSMSFLVRCSKDLHFQLRLYRPRINFVHWNYSSFLFPRAAAHKLGGFWDPVRAGADSEFIERFKLTFGRGSIAQVHADTPLTLALMSSNSISEASSTSMRDAGLGPRSIYTAAYRDWHSTSWTAGEPIQREGQKAPFFVPAVLSSDPISSSKKLDVVVASDFSKRGGTRRCNEVYIQHLADAGHEVGLLHIPSFVTGKNPPGQIDHSYWQLINENSNIDLLTSDSEVETSLLLAHYPPAFRFIPEQLPKIRAEEVFLIANQLSSDLYSEDNRVYNPVDVESNFERWVGAKPTWVPISGLAKEIMSLGDYSKTHESTWHPPIAGDFFSSPVPKGKADNPSMPVIGRHGRDSWEKWPGTRQDIESAYCANSDYEVRILGGVVAAADRLGYVPRNWSISKFDSVPVIKFLSGIDIYLNFVLEDYIEEFGRNVAEAMAMGIPVIMGKKFRSTFGEAAIYCDVDQVCEAVAELWSNPVLYAEKSKMGREFALRNCGPESLTSRFSPFSLGK